MTDAKKSEAVTKDKPEGTTAEEEKDSKSAGRSKEKPPRKSRGTGKKVVAGVNALRSRIASLVWLVAVVCAVVLAVGALLVALKANQHNSIVSFIQTSADKLDLGVFSRKGGIFTFAKDTNNVKGALVNWGIGAIAYLVVGKIVDRIIRP